jgi:dimeric dUTPase (all-alpha-NTP-PPase superfamily)
MDIRDIKEEVPKLNNDAFTQIYNLQMELVNHYVNIESLPKPTLNIDTKAGQLLIKDFTARVVEELGECFESYINMENAMYHNDGPNIDSAINHLQNLNEELSDALHFYVELLIFAGVTNEDIFKYITTNNSNHRYSMAFDKMVVNKDTLGMGIYLQPDFKPYYAGGSWVISDGDLKDEFLKGGRYLGSVGYVLKLKSLLWNITYSLQISRNALKNKPWKQTQMLTDKNIFKNYLCATFLDFCALFRFLGMTEESVMTIYFKKNRINLFRIKSKY